MPTMRVSACARACPHVETNSYPVSHAVPYHVSHFARDVADVVVVVGGVVIGRRLVVAPHSDVADANANGDDVERAPAVVRLLLTR